MARSEEVRIIGSVNRKAARRQLHRLVRGWTSLAGMTWTRRLWSEGALGRIADMEPELWEKASQNPEAANQEARSGVSAISAALSSRNFPRARTGAEPRTNHRIPLAADRSVRRPQPNPLTRHKISCGEPEETIHEAKSVDGKPAARRSQACSPSTSSIG